MAILGFFYISCPYFGKGWDSQSPIGRLIGIQANRSRQTNKNVFTKRINGIERQKNAIA